MTLRSPSSSLNMNTSGPHLNGSTPLCYSINSPPFNYSSTIASACFSAIFCPLGLISNLIAFVVLLQSFKRVQSRSRSFFLIFLGGLVITDFLGLLVTGSIVVSFHIFHFNWRQLDPDCHFCNFMGMSMVFYGLSPLLLGATMATERFIGINRPFSRSRAMPKRRTISMVLIVWMIAGCISLLPVLGVGGYHMQMPGSWCFFNVSSVGADKAFSLIFSLVGLLSLAVSFLLNTVSVVTLVRVCCGPGGSQRRRDHEVEMMVQLILIMAIASICWCPLLVFIAQTVLSGDPLQIKYLLLWLRFASFNQILDPWVYILFRRAVFKRIYPNFNWSRKSILTMYPPLNPNISRMTRSFRRHNQEEMDKTNGTNGTDTSEK